MPVDEELKSAVKNAKSKRSYFAFIQKSATDGTLLVDKSKIPDKDITAAKKKNGGSTTLKGACFGEGERFVFEMSKVPADKDQLEGALDKVIKRDTGIPVKSLCRSGNSPDLAEGSPDATGAGYGVPIPAPNQEAAQPAEKPPVADGSGAKAPAPEQPKPGSGYGVPIPAPQQAKTNSGSGVKTPAPGSAPQQPNLGDAYYEKRKPIEVKLKEGLKQGRSDSPRLKEVFSYSENCAKKQQFDRGMQGLDALDKLLSKPSAAAAPQIGDYRRQYLQRRKPIEPRLVTALKARVPNTERLATTFKIAEHRANNEEFDGAIQALDVVEQLLRAAPVAPENRGSGSEAPQGNVGAREPSSAPQGNEYANIVRPGNGPATGSQPSSAPQGNEYANIVRPGNGPATGSQPSSAPQGNEYANIVRPGNGPATGSQPSSAPQGNEYANVVRPGNGPATGSQPSSAPQGSEYANVVRPANEPARGRAPSNAPEGSQLDYANTVRPSNAPEGSQLDYANTVRAPNAPQENQLDYADAPPPPGPGPGNVDEGGNEPPLNYAGAGEPQDPQAVGSDLDALLNSSMDPVQYEAERGLLVKKINSEWSKSIDLTNAKVDFRSDAEQGSFGKLGRIESGKANSPQLAMKVPLNQDVAAELQHEVDLYEKAGEHPNIAKCVGIVEVDGHRGLVMEFVDGKNMKKTMSALQDAYKDGKVSHQEYWGMMQFMMRETLKGLAQLEQQGVVHNDIRPDNLMVDKNTGDVKIIDFGVAVATGEMVQKFPLRSGTASPDLAQTADRPSGGTVTPKHDDFAVGAMTYQAGEKQVFDYNQPGVTPSVPMINAFASFAPADQVAIRPADENHPAFTQDAQGTATKQPGRYGASTAYTDFVNKLMDPDPTKRLSATQALNEPFLTDSPIDDEAARKLISGLLSPAEQEPEASSNVQPAEPGEPLNYATRTEGRSA